MKWALVLGALTTTLSLLAPASARAAEGYEAAATTTLAVRADGDGAALRQTWTITCVATDPDPAAALRPQGKDLRFAAAPDEVLAVSVDDAVYGFDDAAGGYDYDGVVGAHVFARFVGRCGTDKFFDEVVVDSIAVVTAPRLEAPFAVRRLDTFETVEAIPAGVDVELVDLPVVARPRGDERVVVSVVDAAGSAVASVELGAVDVGLEGRARISPAFATSALGDVVVVATFLERASAPLAFAVVPDDGGAEGEGEGDVGTGPETPASIGCSTAGAPAGVVVLLVVLRRRRRR